MPTNSTSSENQSFLSRINPLESKLGRKLALTTVLAFGATTLAACGGTPAPAETTQAQEQTPKPSPEVTETPETPAMGYLEHDPAITPENAEQRLSELQFSADLSVEEAGKHFNEVLTGWSTAGATTETFKQWWDAGLPDETVFAQAIAEENTKVYATALFGEDYATIEDEFIKNTIINVEKGNTDNIVNFLRTYFDDEFPNQNPEETQEPWHVETNVLEVTEGEPTEGAMTLVVQRQTESNADKTVFKGQFAEEGHIANSFVTLTPSETPGVNVVSKLSIVDVQ